MENLTIVSTTKNVQAKEEINGTNVTYNWNFVEGSAPLAIVFSVQREGGQISGTFYTDTKRFDVSNTRYKAGDASLIDGIFNTCVGIVEDDTAD